MAGTSARGSRPLLLLRFAVVVVVVVVPFKNVEESLLWDPRTSFAISRAVVEEVLQFQWHFR